MRVTRCHVDAALVAGSRLRLPDAVAQHLVRVLRLGVGDVCVLFNGDGHDHHAQLVSADKRGAEVEIGPARRIDSESPLRITLLQGVARGEKMDWILQKATELGVSSVLPVTSDRSDVKLDAERAAKRHAHWHSVVVAACEQSSRAVLPLVMAPAALDAALDTLPPGALRLTLDPHAHAGAADLSPPDAAGIVIAIGPEGGWSPRDHSALAAAGFSGLRLGPRVLRTETAGIAAISALQARFGDL